MRTQYYVATSLDGYIAGPGHDLDWLLRFGDVDGGGYAAFVAEMGALAMGASTYEWLARHLAASGEPWPYAQPAWVFTTRALAAVAGADIRFVRGDVAPVHAAMAAAAGGRNIWLVGGGDLVGQFHDRGLLDELVIHVAPVTLGAGAPLLPRRIATPPLRLLSCQVGGASFVELRYALARPAV